MAAPFVLVTCALTGIGRATAHAFAREGSRIVVSGRRDEEGKKLAEELRAAGAEAEFRRADVRHEEDVRSLVDWTVERFGRVDVAVNNAGTEGKPGPVTAQTAETSSHRRKRLSSRVLPSPSTAANWLDSGLRPRRQNTTTRTSVAVLLGMTGWGLTFKHTIL
jgi:NAD(P)-dependent dehydrogenase (short-subunit alcohol dehydrogenase family)